MRSKHLLGRQAKPIETTHKEIGPKKIEEKETECNWKAQGQQKKQAPYKKQDKNPPLHLSPPVQEGNCVTLMVLRCSLSLVTQVLRMV